MKLSRLLVLSALMCKALLAEDWNIDADGTWNTASNWNPPIVPNGAGSVANLNLPTTASRTVDLTILSFQVDTLNFDSAFGYNITDGTLQVNDSITVTNVNGTGAHGIDPNITLQTGGANLDITTAATTSLGIGGTITGAGSVTVSGMGVALFSGNNTYTGGTIIESELTITNQNSLGSSGTELATINGGTLSITGDFTSTRPLTIGASGGSIDVQVGNTYTYQGTLSGTTALTFNPSGTGTFNLDGDASGYTGTATVSNGTLQFSNEGLGGDLVNNASLVLTGTNTYGGDISGTGTVTKTSSGTYTLNGANTYSGGTSVTGGVLSVNDESNLGNASGDLTLDNGTILFNNTTTSTRDITLGSLGGTVRLPTSPMTLTLNGTISGPGQLTLEANGDEITLNGSNTYTGDTVFITTIAQVSSDDNFGSGNTIIMSSQGDGGEIVATGSFDLTKDIVFQGTEGQFTPDPGVTFTLSGIISGTAGQISLGSSTGTLVITGNNTYVSTENFLNGPVEISSNDNLGNVSNPLVFNGGGSLLRTTASFSTAREWGFNLPSGRIETNGGTTLTHTGPITNPGTFTKEGGGTLILNGTSQDTVNFIVNNGILQGTTASLTGTISNTTTTTFDQAFNGTYSGTISGGGNLNKQGSGIVSMNGAQPMSGTTTVIGGELNLNGSLGGNVIVNNGATYSGNATCGDLNNSGTLSPGNSIGTTTVTGNFTQGANGTLIIEIDHFGNTDLVDITAAAALDGAVIISPLPGIYKGDELYTFLTATGGVGGTFSSESATNGESFLINYFANSVQLDFNHIGSVTPIPINQLSGNAKAIADYLFCTGFAPSDPDLLVVLRQLVTLPPDQFIQELDQMSPTQFGALPLAVLQTSHQMADTFVSNAEKFYGCDRCGTSNNARTKMTDTAVWVAPMGQWHHQKGVEDQVGFNAKSLGLAAGVSHLFSTFMNLTVGAGYSYTDLGWKENAGNGHWNSLYLSPSFGIVNKRWFTNLMLQGAVNFFHINRKVDFSGINRTATNTHNSYDLLVRYDGGYKFRWNASSASSALYLMPIFRLSYLNMFEAGYTESGADSINLSVDRKYSAFLQPELLFKVIREFYPKGFCITPSAHLGYIANIPLSSGTYTSHFHREELCKPEFSVTSFHRMTNQLVVGFDLRVNKKDKSAFDVSYEGRLLDNVYVNEAKVKFDYEF